MSSTKIEFAVQMTCENCVQAVRKSLENVPEVKVVDINLSTGSVVVDTALSAGKVLKYLEVSGLKVALRGYGTLAGVAVLDTGSTSVKGVVRFVQQAPEVCIIDGTIDGLTPGKHQLSVHECGDTSGGCETVGNFFTPENQSSNRIYGNLGQVVAEPNGRAAFRFDNNVIKLSDIIGRALVVSDPSQGNRLACGVIARSAGLFQNPKTICACDGVTIWNEKVTPKATL